MQISHLSLTNFRNYGRLELALPSGVTLLHGDNAQGKTNILEAIYYLATTKSHHAEQDSQLINWAADLPDERVVVGRLVARLQTNRGARQLEMRLIKERQRGRDSFRREALVNRRKVRLMDLLGQLRVVLFLPQDVQLITGSPAERRRFLNITMCQIDGTYCRNLSAYNKVLDQRNALLRQIGESGKGHDLLPIYTEKLVDLGSRVVARRATFLTELAREAQHIHYQSLTAGKETIRLYYLPRLQDKPSPRQHEDMNQNPLIPLGEWLAAQSDTPAIVDRYAQAMEKSTAQDIARQITTMGPHRDDWCFWLNGRRLSSYGSRGQQRSAMLALKMAEINWMRQQTGEMPLLLLDEVVAELDERRRALLLEYVQSSTQALLTATDPDMFPAEFKEQATLMRVQNGRVELT